MNKLLLLVPAALAASFLGCAASDAPIGARNIEVVHLVFSEVWSKGNVALIDSEIPLPTTTSRFPKSPSFD